MINSPIIGGNGGYGFNLTTALAYDSVLTHPQICDAIGNGGAGGVNIGASSVPPFHGRSAGAGGSTGQGGSSGKGSGVVVITW